MQAHEVFIGVDVAKASLSSCIYGTAGRYELDNDEKSISQWLATLPATASIAVESTGRYHLAVVRLAHASGRRAFVLNARDVYFYAKALGARGKTDRTDAQIIARYLAEHHAALKAWTPGTVAQERLQELLRCRAGVTSKRAALRQVLRDMPELDAAVLALEQQFDVLLDRIDEQIAAVLAQDERLSEGCARLRTITGFGPQGSVLLAALLSRVGFANADAVVAYSGLDPRPNDSGAKTGRRRISKRAAQSCAGSCTWRRSRHRTARHSGRCTARSRPKGSSRRKHWSFLPASFCAWPGPSGRPASPSIHPC